MPASESQLHINLNKIEDWADCNDFKFPQSKTRFIFVGEWIFILFTFWFYMMTPFLSKKECNFLGISRESKLIFIPHIIKDLKKKYVKALYLMSCFNNDWVRDRAVLLQLYRAIVRSRSNYGYFILRSM